MRVVAERALTHLCPHVDERDHGTVIASWTGDAIELHAFGRYLDRWADEKVTHEHLTAAIADHLHNEGAIDPIVTTAWSTGGFAVTVIAR